MKIKLKEKPTLYKGQERVIEKFAWFPLWAGNEIRWLEKVKIRQKVVECYGTCWSTWLAWENVRFE